MGKSFDHFEHIYKKSCKKYWQIQFQKENIFWCEVLLVSNLKSM